MLTGVRRYGRKPPVVTDEKLDKPVQELTMTLDTWYDTKQKPTSNRLKLHHIIDEDLQRLFPETEGNRQRMFFRPIVAD